MNLKLLVFILFIASFTGCSSEAPRSEPSNVKVECAPLETISQTSLTVLPVETYIQDSLLKKHFSFQALNTANYLGLIPALKSIVSASKEEQKDKIRDLNTKFSTVFIKISTTSAELDCEEERADQIADYLLDITGSRNRMLTLYSIILAALGTIIVSLMDLIFNTKKITFRSVQILFGIAVAVIGISILTSQEIQISFKHKRNLLGEVGTGKNGKHFHSEIWNYLTEPTVGDERKSPLREVLLERWKTTGELGAKQEEDKKKSLFLLFGKGGVYTASELRIRANFFDQLESTVNLMKSEVLNLQEQLNRISKVY